LHSTRKIVLPKPGVRGSSPLRDANKIKDLLSKMTSRFSDHFRWRYALA
jgi:hypothetical protein